MTLLFLLWISALALTAVAAAGFMLLVVARLMHKGREKALARSRAIILGLLVDPRVSAERLERHVRRAADQDMLSLIVLEVISLISGEARSSFAERLLAAGADDRLRRQALTGERGQRLRAIEALAAFPNPVTAACLKDMWSDADPIIRLVALVTSLDTPSPPPFRTVLRIATTSGARLQARTRHLIRRAAETSLDEAAQTLVRRDLPAWLRVSLCEALNGSSDYRAVLALKAAAMDPDPELRATAIEALAASGASEGFGAVMDAVDDPVWLVRVRAVSAVGRLKLTAAKASIEMRTADSNWWVRLRAAETLGLLNAEPLPGFQAC